MVPHLVRAWVPLLTCTKVLLVSLLMAILAILVTRDNQDLATEGLVPMVHHKVPMVPGLVSIPAIHLSLDNITTVGMDLTLHLAKEALLPLVSLLQEQEWEHHHLADLLDTEDTDHLILGDHLQATMVATLPAQLTPVAILLPRLAPAVTSLTVIAIVTMIDRNQ